MSMDCPICCSQEVSHFHDVGERELLICACCRHIFWSRMPAEADLIEFYSTRYGWSHRQESIQTGNVNYYETHADELVHMHGGSAHEIAIADIGCSYPCLLDAARRKGFREAIGVDWDRGAHIFGRERGVDMMTPTEFFEDVPDASIDILRFSHTIEHLIDPRGQFRRMVQKVRNGGLIYITQPSFPVFTVGGPGLALKDTVWPEHLHFFSPVSLCRLVEEADLQITTFFTHQNSDSVWRRWGSHVDVAHARRLLRDTAKRAQFGHEKRGNFPRYTGENSSLYARRGAVRRSPRRGAGGIASARRLVSRVSLRLSRRNDLPDASQRLSAGKDHLRTFFCDHVTGADVVIDVGANEGIYSRIFAERAKACYCVEPNPATFKLLSQNLSGTSANLLQTAVSDRCGPIDFYLDQRPNTAGCASSVNVLDDLHAEGYAERVTVPAITIDSLCASHRIAPTLIKIDVEGHEPAVFRGAQRTIEQYRPLLVFEFWESWWDRGYSAIFRDLRNNYDLVRIQDGADALRIYQGAYDGNGAVDIVAFPRKGWLRRAARAMCRVGNRPSTRSVTASPSAGGNAYASTRRSESLLHTV